MRDKIVAGVLGAVLVLALGACGGGSSNKTAASDTSSSSAKSSSSKSSSSSSKGGGSNDAFCTELAKDEKVFDSQSNPDSSDIVSALDKLVDVAPDAIRDDMQTVATGSARQLEVFDSAGSDLSDITSALSDLSDSIDTAELQRATKNIEKFAKDQCGIDLESESSSSQSS